MMPKISHPTLQTLTNSFPLLVPIDLLMYITTPTNTIEMLYPLVPNHVHDP
jgi:hypothetical protein